MENVLSTVMPLAVEVPLLTTNHISSKHLFFLYKEDWSFANFTNIVFFFQSNLFPKVYFSQVVRLQIGSKLFNKVSLSFCPGKVFRPNSEKFSPPSDLTLGLGGSTMSNVLLKNSRNKASPSSGRFARTIYCNQNPE